MVTATSGKATITPEFRKMLGNLTKAGGLKKKCADKVMAAVTEAHLNGIISLARTDNGETRGRFEKYELGINAHRLVVQLVN